MLRYLSNICTIIFIFAFIILPQEVSNWTMPYISDAYTVVLWHFDETAGNIVADAGPNKYDGVSTNTNISISMNGFGNAREFLDDPTGYITFGNFNLPQFEGTLEYWINPNIRPVTSCDHSHFFVKGTHGNSGSGFTFYNRLYNDTDVDFGVGDSGGDTGRRFENVFNYNEWQHVALTWTTVETKMYVNGEMISVMDPFPIGIGQSSDEVALGKWGSQLYTSCRYLGYIDELRISNIARTFKPPSALVAFYPFNGNANDESGNSHHGSIIGNPSFIQDRNGNPNSALSFDGIDDWIEVNSSSLFPSDAITICYWINRDGNDITSLQNYISKELSFQSYILDNSGGENIFESGYWLGSPGVWTGYHTNYKVIMLNEWVFYAFTYDNNTQTAKSYVNGVLDNTVVETDPNYYLRSSNQKMFIGRNGSANVYHIQGFLDDIRIYDRALTALEIYELFDDVIPVELASFTAILIHNKVILNWQTRTEINNLGFEIQRKIDKDWQKITFIEGNGTTTDEINYQFIDEFKYNSVKGIIQYRLKQVDFNGTYEYSDVVEVNVDFMPKGYVLYQNYPNPFNPRSKIKYALPQSSRVNLTVYNAIGEVVIVLVNEVQDEGFHEIDFDSSSAAGGLPSGIYLYRLVANDNIQVKKMILLK